MQYTQTMLNEYEQFVDFVLENNYYELEETSYDELAEIALREHFEDEFRKKLKPRKSWHKDGF